MDVKEIIRQFVLDDLSLDDTIKDLADDDLLIDNGIIDSMGILSLLAFLDEKFGILFSEGEVNTENFGTLRSICDLIAKKMAQAC